MRVIAGKAKGYPLKAPRGLNTRPTTDRVKESIFNILQTRLYDSIIIDFFSGSGNLGIEALSRGASKAYFIDNSKSSIISIKENLKKTSLISNSIILEMNVLSAIDKLGCQGVQADIIFLDPPYCKGLIEPTLEGIYSFKLLKKNGIVIVEHDKKDEVSETIYSFEKYRTNKYGDIAVSFYRLREAP